MDHVKVGVIGAGRMGARHCRIFSNLRGAELVGVHDVNVQTGQKVAQQYNAMFYDDLSEMLSQVDAVSIASPTKLHFEMAERCLAEGKHVLVEKPITETVAQARKLTEISECCNLVCMVGHIERFNPAYQELINVLDGKEILAVNVRRLSSFQGSNLDVDVVLDLMIHDTDLVLNMIGSEPDRIDVYGLKVFSNTIDHAVVNFQAKSGPLYTMTASRITEHKVRSIEVTTSDAYLECDLLNKSIEVHRQTIGEYLNNKQLGIKYRQESIVERIQIPTAEPLFSELQHFIECILNNRPTLIPARAGWKALEMAENIRNGIYAKWGSQ